MRRVAEATARSRAAIGGDEIHAVTLVSESARVGPGIWLVKVRLLMRDGTSKAFECNSTELEVFSVREVPAG